jgi:hypothetical protein
MNPVDLVIAWNWEFDADYIHGIERECAHRTVSTYQVRPDNLPASLASIREGTFSAKTFYDRASDADEAFLPLVEYFRQASARVVNPHGAVAHAIDKATMHLEFITNGINVPRTVILSPYRHQNVCTFTERDAEWLGTPFVIKPANTTGGGTGVVLDAETAADVAGARQVHPDDKYLVQEFIHPDNLGGKRAWFRVYSVFGEILLCWWDDQTHEYSELSADEERRYALGGLRDVMTTIRRICRLDFFSSEVARTGNGTYVVVDYVNEICDMRLKSKYVNGAPDAIVHRIEALVAGAVAGWVKGGHAAD